MVLNIVFDDMADVRCIKITTFGVFIYIYIYMYIYAEYTRMIYYVLCSLKCVWYKHV